MFLVSGVFVGWVKEMIFIGMIVIEAFILKVSYNKVVALWDTYFHQLEWTLPAPRMSYIDAFWILLFLHIIGIVVARIVKSITPKFVHIEQKSESKSE